MILEGDDEIGIKEACRSQVKKEKVEIKVRQAITGYVLQIHYCIVPFTLLTYYLEITLEKKVELYRK